MSRVDDPLAEADKHERESWDIGTCIECGHDGWPCPTRKIADELRRMRDAVLAVADAAVFTNVLPEADPIQWRIALAARLRRIAEGGGS